MTSSHSWSYLIYSVIKIDEFLVFLKKETCMLGFTNDISRSISVF